MRDGGEKNFAGYALHLLDGLLECPPVGDGLVEPLELFFGESQTDGFAFDLTGPLKAGATCTGPAILDVAFADPAHLGQGLAQVSVGGLKL